jgi:hypothetical protein
MKVILTYLSGFHTFRRYHGDIPSLDSCRMGGRQQQTSRFNFFLSAPFLTLLHTYLLPSFCLSFGRIERTYSIKTRERTDERKTRKRTDRYRETTKERTNIISILGVQGVGKSTGTAHKNSKDSARVSAPSLQRQVHQDMNGVLWSG